MRQQRKSVCFHDQGEDPTSAGAFPSTVRGGRRDSAVVVRSGSGGGDRCDALTTEAVLDLIKAQDPWETPQRREDIVRRLSLVAAGSRTDQRRVSTVPIDQVVRRRSSVHCIGVSEEPATADGSINIVNREDGGGGGFPVVAPTSRNASFRRVASSGVGSGADPTSPSADDGPRFMSVATRYRLPNKALSPFDDEGLLPTNAGALSPKDSTRFLSSVRQGRFGSASERRPSHRQSLRASIFARGDDELRRASQLSVRTTALTAAPPTPSSKRSHRRHLLKKDSVLPESSDSENEDAEIAEARALAEKKRNEETMMQQLTSRSLSTVLLATLSQKITGAVRSNSRAPHPPLWLLRKRLALTMLQTFLMSPKTPSAYKAAIVITASNIDADWKRKIMRKLHKEKGVRGAIASGDASLACQIEWVIGVRSQLTGAPDATIEWAARVDPQGSDGSRGALQANGAATATVPAFPPTGPFLGQSLEAAPRGAHIDDVDSADDDSTLEQPPRAFPNQPVVHRNRGSLDARLAGFSFGVGDAVGRQSMVATRAVHRGSSSSHQDSEVHSFFESESEEDDDVSSTDSLRDCQDEAHCKEDEEEEDLPLDCVKHVAKPLGSLAESIAYHRGRCGNAAMRVEPLQFVGSSSTKTPRSFRLGANRGQHAPRVSPVALSLGHFRRATSPDGGGTGEAEGADASRRSMDAKDAPPITRRDVDRFVANVACEAAVATELRCIYIHHTPMTFKHVARLTHGAFAAMQPRFLHKLALRFCELDGVALAPLLAWLAIDHNGPAALHTLDLADNRISAKDLSVVAVAICGVPSLVHLSLRNNPLSLYYEEAQQRINDNHREAMRLYNEEQRQRNNKADDWNLSIPRTSPPGGGGYGSGYGSGVAARQNSALAGSFYDSLPSGATMLRGPARPPPPPPMNPEVAPHQLIASFITSLNQIEHLDLGFCGLGDTSVVKICNYLHDSDCRIKFLNIDGAGMTITVSALLLDTIKRHCRSLLYVSLRYVYFCSGPQFQRKLCHTLRRRVWHALKESGEYDAIKEKECRRRYRRETMRTGLGDGGNSPVARRGRRSTIQPDADEEEDASDETVTDVSVSSQEEEAADGDAVVVPPSVEIPSVHPPLAHLYVRLRALERWCDAKLAYRAQHAERETSRMLTSSGTVGSLGNLSQLRTSESFIGSRRRHRQNGDNRSRSVKPPSSSDDPNPPLGDAAADGNRRPFFVFVDGSDEATTGSDATTPQSTATAATSNSSMHAPFGGQTPPPSSVVTPRPAATGGGVRWRLSVDSNEGTSGTPTPRRGGSVAHATGDGGVDTGTGGVSFLVSLPEVVGAVSGTVSPSSSDGRRRQYGVSLTPKAHQHRSSIRSGGDRRPSLVLPRPRERPHWKTYGSAEEAGRDVGDGDSDPDYISSEEPSEGDEEVGNDSLTELDVEEGDTVDDWGGWNLMGLHRGYGRYTTNSPSLAKRRRRARGKPA